MNFSFLAYRDFKKEYSTYHLDRCDKCGGNCELEESSVSVTIEARLLNFPELCLLVCQSCGRKYIPEYSKQMIDGAYRSMVKEGQYVGDFVPKGYKKKFDYCVEQDYEYDHRDFYNIPGLCYDDEHSIEGFLTPVYFEKQALIYFISMPEYEVNIFSETYGNIGMKDPDEIYTYEWNIPFGFNRNGKLVFWLGDLSYMDNRSKGIIKGFNVPSDHQLIGSEFYQAQMNCVFSDPIKETQVISSKTAFIDNIYKGFAIDIKHLEEECSEHIDKIKRPVVFSEVNVSTVINAYDKVLVEGFSVDALRQLYEVMYSDEERDPAYKKWGRVKGSSQFRDSWR